MNDLKMLPMTFKQCEETLADAAGRALGGLIKN